MRQCVAIKHYISKAMPSLPQIVHTLSTQPTHFLVCCRNAVLKAPIGSAGQRDSQNARQAEPATVYP